MEISPEDRDGRGDLSAMSEDEHDAAQEAIITSRLERDRTLGAIHRLEASLGRAADIGTWLETVQSNLHLLEDAMVEEQRELHRPDALLALIASRHPRRFGPRIRGLREQYGDVVRQVASLRRQLENAGEDNLNAEDLRHRAGWIIRALHHCRGRQADLVYDALRLELGERPA